MPKFDLVEAWIDNVAISHSNSNSTRIAYKNNFRLFCDFIGKTPGQIISEFENSSDRQFRRRYAQYIRGFMSSEFKKGMSPCTIGCRQAAVKSFFKYNDLPLGYVAAARMRVIYHNKDITHDEVKIILDASKPRQKAFFSLMAQSGLRPQTICMLRLKDVELNHEAPAKIDVPIEIAKGKYRAYWTFMGSEALKYLKGYLNTRPPINEQDLLFVKQGTKQQANPKSFSGIFSRTLQKLQQKGLIEVEQKAKGKPRDIRLYNLRNFFRKFANQAGFTFVQFWMGHIVKEGQEEHYRPKDVEFHRQLYAEKAMPFLRLETATPSETDKVIQSYTQKVAELTEQLEQRDRELEELKNKIQTVEDGGTDLYQRVNELEKGIEGLGQIYGFLHGKKFMEDIEDTIQEVIKQREKQGKAKTKRET